MQQEIKSYPWFGRGELLTSASLNNAFHYNDEQSRLSRHYLEGFGILEGLDYSFNNKVLKLSKGVCVTPNGFLVIVEEDIQFSGALKDGVRYRLIRKSEKVKGSVAIPNLKDYVVVLKASIETASSLNCSELSCDRRSATKELSINLYLYPRMNRRVSTYQISPVRHSVRLARIHADASNINILNRVLHAKFNYNWSQVNLGISALCRILNPGFDPNKSDKKGKHWLHPLLCWSRLFEDAGFLAKKLSKLAINKNWHLSMTQFPVYYFEHLEIMATAINECLAYYNRFAQQYPIIPMNAIHNGDEIDLGADVSSTSSVRYRSVFGQALPDRECQERAKQLERLMKRVVCLTMNFMGNNNFMGNRAIRWYNPEKPLCERPIPYFYGKFIRGKNYKRLISNLEELADLWSAPCAYAPFVEELHWDYVQNDDDSPSNNVGERLFLEGCYRHNIDDVYNFLKRHIDLYGLDMTVEKVKMVKKSLLDNKKNRLCDLVYNQISGAGKGNPIIMLKSKLESHARTYHMDNYEEPLCGVLVQNQLSTVSIDDYMAYVRESEKAKNTKRQGDIKRRDCLSFLKLQSFYNLSYPKELRGLQFLQGHPNGSTIYLFHFNNKFIIDASIKKRE